MPPGMKLQTHERFCCGHRTSTNHEERIGRSLVGIYGSLCTYTGEEQHTWEC